MTINNFWTPATIFTELTLARLISTFMSQLMIWMKDKARKETKKEMERRKMMMMKKMKTK